MDIIPVIFITTEKVESSDQVYVCRITLSSNSLGVLYGEDPLNINFNLVFLDLALIILITKMIRILLKPLKQPRVVSDVIIRSQKDRNKKHMENGPRVQRAKTRAQPRPPAKNHHVDDAMSASECQAIVSAIRGSTAA
ncbi:unnamed protein product [Dovyalis caffra]|uniref:Uncharacterized protein n=1 Tax=Dovyalis caffra TaxID=77055 RepID=A0AAV1RC96_9ROSI|nr:unnamed protein product [Dovyalis caffra]